MTTVAEQTARTAARVYLEAFNRGDPPAAAVRAHFHDSEKVARGALHLARQRGWLPATDGPRPVGDGPYITGRIRKVAEVCGVEPRVLYDAIVEHANGDLRIGRKGGGK